ncbi:hypothetical protein BGY98DRAFT_1179612 [Russula aff. rugulosa BPL654]|nr:hypothetical protein BGY98DRAFT_1179612 [Russula aff. rugulosa BPL654]
MIDIMNMVIKLKKFFRDKVTHADRIFPSILSAVSRRGPLAVAVAAGLPNDLDFSSCRSEDVSMMRNNLVERLGHTHCCLGGRLDEYTSRPGCERLLIERDEREVAGAPESPDRRARLILGQALRSEKRDNRLLFPTDELPMRSDLILMSSCDHDRGVGVVVRLVMLRVWRWVTGHRILCVQVPVGVGGALMELASPGSRGVVVVQEKRK